MVKSGEGVGQSKGTAAAGPALSVDESKERAM